MTGDTDRDAELILDEIDAAFPEAVPGAAAARSSYGRLPAAVVDLITGATHARWLVFDCSFELDAFEFEHRFKHTTYDTEAFPGVIYHPDRIRSHDDDVAAVVFNDGTVVVFARSRVAVDRTHSHVRDAIASTSRQLRADPERTGPPDVTVRNATVRDGPDEVWPAASHLDADARGSETEAPPVSRPRQVADAMSDGDGPIQPGDFVYLDVTALDPDGTRRSPDLLGLRDSVAVLVGSDLLPTALGERLVGAEVGDTGYVELGAGDGTPTGLDEALPVPVAAALDRTGVSDAWTFLAADPEELAERLRRQPEGVRDLQWAVSETLAGRTLLEYEVRRADRWRPTDAAVDAGTEVAPDTDAPTRDALDATDAGITGGIAPADRWATFRGGVRRTGHGAGAVPREGIDEEWSRTVHDPVRASPTVVDGVVIVTTESGTILAYDTDGHELWSQEVGESVSSPTVARNTVFVGTDGGGVLALDVRSGERRWEYFDVPASVHSAPAVFDGVAYAGGGDGSLCAIDVSTGTERWTFSANGPIRSSPAVADGTVYVGSDDGAINAVDAASSDRTWVRAADHPIRSTPAVTDDAVVATGKAGVWAIDSDTDDVCWYTHLPWIKSSPAVAHGRVFVGSDDHNLYALDATDGEVLWSYETGHYVRSSPAVADGVVVVGSMDGYVYGLDAATGERCWSFETGGPTDRTGVYSSPALADGTVYVGCDAGRIYGLAE